MKRFVLGTDRGQSTLLPECLDDWVDESNPVRVIELRWGPKALDVRDIEETLIAACAACLQLVTWMAERVEHPEIAVRLSRCFEELKRQL